MKKILYSILFLTLLSASPGYSAVTTDPDITGVPDGGALPGPSDSYGFNVISGTRVETTFLNASSLTAQIMTTWDAVINGSLTVNGPSTFAGIENHSAILDNATSNQVAYTFDYDCNKLTSGECIGLRLRMTDTSSPDNDDLAIFESPPGTKRFTFTRTGILALEGVTATASVKTPLLFTIGAGVPLEIQKDRTFSSASDMITMFEGTKATNSSGQVNGTSKIPIVNTSGTGKFVGSYQNISTITEGSGGTFHEEWATERSVVATLDDEGKLGLGIVATTQLHVNTNKADTVAIATFGNLSSAIQIFAVQSSPEGRVTANRGDRAFGINGNAEGAEWTKHTGDGTSIGWKKDIINHKGSIHIHDNTVPTVLNTADTPHLIFGVFTSLTENGYTFSAGEDGTISSFSDYSSTVAGAVLANSTVLTWTGSQPVTINDTANYNGIFEATFVNTSSFYFTDTFVATETGAWQKGDCLIAATGTADNYNIEYRGFGEKESGGGTDRYEWEIYKYTPGSDPDTIENAEEKKAFSGANVPDDFGGLGETSIADGDHICVGLLGLGHSIDFTNEHFYFRIEN